MSYEMDKNDMTLYSYLRSIITSQKSIKFYLNQMSYNKDTCAPTFFIHNDEILELFYIIKAQKRQGQLRKALNLKESTIV